MTEDEARQRLILSMCPERVCRTCGEPSRRIVGKAEYVKSDGSPAHLKPDMWRKHKERPGGVLVNQSGGSGFRQEAIRQAPTIGWTDCGHDDWRPGVVLDPFA